MRELQGCRNEGFQILYPAGGTGSDEPAVGGAILGSALSLLECSQDIRNHLKPYLGNVIVVDGVDTALTLLKKDQCNRIATLDGVFFDGPGRMMVAPSEDIELTLLEYESKLDELTRAETRASALKEKTIGRREDLLSAKLKLQEEEGQVMAQLSAAEDREAELKSDYHDAEIRLVRAKENGANLVASETETDTSIIAIRQKLERFKKASEYDSAAGEDRGYGLAQLEEDALALKKQKDDIRDQLAEMKLREATLGGQVETLRSRINGCEELRKELDELMHSKHADIQKIEEQIAASKSPGCTGNTRFNPAAEGQREIVQRPERIC
jgi:chromosome segregation ATPase